MSSSSNTPAAGPSRARSAAAVTGASPVRAQWVLVTGASSGIGKALSLALAQRGAHLVLCARSAPRLEELAATLRELHGAQVQTFACDLQQPDAANQLQLELAQRGIEIDVLVNNAGFGSAGRLQRQDRSHIAAMTQLNCIAVAELTHCLLPGMLKRKRGGILNVASLSAFVPTPYMAVYGATKAYVLSLTAALAEEVRGSGVRVSAVCPGPVPTEFQGRAGYGALDASNPAVLSADEVAERALLAYERGRLVCVPGAVNRLQATLSGLVPLPWLARIAASVLRKRGRDL